MHAPHAGALRARGAWLCWGLRTASDGRHRLKWAPLTLQTCMWRVSAASRPSAVADLCTARKEHAAGARRPRRRCTGSRRGAGAGARQSRRRRPRKARCRAPVAPPSGCWAPPTRGRGGVSVPKRRSALVPSQQWNGRQPRGPTAGRAGTHCRGLSFKGTLVLLMVVLARPALLSVREKQRAQGVARLPPSAERLLRVLTHGFVRFALGGYGAVHGVARALARRATSACKQARARGWLPQSARLLRSCYQ